MFKKIYLKIIDTGERPMLEKKFEEIHDEGVKFAYKFASDFVKDKTVLDFGCGGGYGTEYLSRFTNLNVTGFDIDKKTIGINREYYKNKNLQFESEKDRLGKYDVITSFQVIEHIKERNVDNLLSNIKKHLKDDGLFLCATPNKLVTSNDLKKPVMVFHEKEYSPSEFKEKLDRLFLKVLIYGQRRSVDEGNISRREEIVRRLSQIEVVRLISRHLPMAIKYLLMGDPKKIEEMTYRLVDDQKEIDKSFILIAACYSRK
ncbi:MAG: class I SAM-dependent methyltransferase [Parcubacteria group bacterium]|jgi:SAM-dependent methyltransferase